MQEPEYAQVLGGVCERAVVSGGRVYLKQLPDGHGGVTRGRQGEPHL